MRSSWARFAGRHNQHNRGRTFPIRNLKKIGNAVDDLALDLRNQYLIAYRPSNLAHEGSWHKVSVSFKPPQGASRLGLRQGWLLCSVEMTLCLSIIRLQAARKLAGPCGVHHRVRVCRISAEVMGETDVDELQAWIDPDYSPARAI